MQIFGNFISNVNRETGTNRDRQAEPDDSTSLSLSLLAEKTAAWNKNIPYED